MRPTNNSSNPEIKKINESKSISSSAISPKKPRLEHKEKAKIDEDCIKRYKYLIKQSDVFEEIIKITANPHLVEAIEVLSSEDVVLDKKKGRHRKTEDEEDEELLKIEDTQIVSFEESPVYVKNGKMRDYQVQGLNWLVAIYENKINGILADEMGLGKTLQIISFIGYLRYYKNIKGKHLVIVPKSTLNNWQLEFNKWIPEIKTTILKGSKDEREELKKEILDEQTDVVITSYEMVLLSKPMLNKINWHEMIIDEAHRIKNENAKLSVIVREFKSKHRLLITGTPLQNNLHELWSLLNYLLPEIFYSSELFDSWFEVNNKNGDQPNTGIDIQKNTSIVKKLHDILKPFFLRRIKMEVEKSLLPKKELHLYIGMSNMQLQWYKSILEKDPCAINGLVSKKEGQTRLLNIVMQLRKCCNHPYLFHGAELGPPYTTDYHIIENSAKLKLLDGLLSNLKKAGSKVLIFSQMSRMLDILEDYCQYRGHECCRIDGGTSHEERIESIDDFNSPKSSKFVFLLTTRAGGQGINLVAADTVIIYDSDWNPQVDLQAQDRAHRIGQKKQVTVYRLITENSVEEKVLERSLQKLRLDQLVIQQGSAAAQQKNPNKAQLLDMIRHGAKDIINNPTNETADFDIESILKQGEKKTAETLQKYAGLNIEDLKKYTTENSESTYVWDGEDYRLKHNKDTELTWINISKRERKPRFWKDGYNINYGTGSANKLPRPPKQITLHDYHFYPQRLKTLQEKEIRYYKKTIGEKIYDSSDYEDESVMEERVALKNEQLLINEAQPLTEEELLEKEELSKKGFTNWSRKDFNNFIKSMEKFGKKKIDLISTCVEGKSPEEVKEYYNVFWNRISEIKNYEKIVQSIEREYKKSKSLKAIQKVLTLILSEVKTPIVNLNLSRVINGRNYYAEEADRFIICSVEKIGLKDPDLFLKLRKEIISSPMFRFDWFLKSRSPSELQRRTLVLLNVLFKEKGVDTQILSHIK